MHKCIICGGPTTIPPVCYDLRCEQEWQAQVPPDDYPEQTEPDYV